MLKEPCIVESDKAIVVSDVHVDEWPKELPDDHRAKRRALIDFLTWVRDESGADLVVVNGDMVDIPQKGDEPFLPTFFDIFDIFFDMYRSGINIVYLVGNHDAGIPSLFLGREYPLTPPQPFVLIRSGDRCIAVEHGHLVDAWLWAYVQLRVSLLTPPAPPELMKHFTTPGLVPSDRYQPIWSSVGQHVFESLQWRPNGLEFTDEEMRLGLSLMVQNLDEDFADVRDNTEPFRQRERALAALNEDGLTPDDLRTPAQIPDAALKHFRTLGDVYYSRIPWRRAARNRLRQIRHVFNHDPDSIIFGHIHKADHHQWEEDGQAHHYYNDGSWVHHSADFLHIEDGNIEVFERTWTDPLPL